MQDAHHDVVRLLSPITTNHIDPSLDGGSSIVGLPREIKVEMSTQQKKSGFDVKGRSKQYSDISLDNKVIGISPGKIT